MKLAMFFQDLSTSFSLETGLTLSHYIKLPNMSYFHIRDRYVQQNLSILIPVV